MSAFNPELLAEFARSYGFHYDVCDPGTLVRDVSFEMERGLAGKASPLPMIPTYLRPASGARAGRAVVALDAGGTNFRAARMTFGGPGKPETLGSARAPMPGTRGRLGAEAFFDEIAALAAPFFDADAYGGPVEGVGFCFSYALQMKEDGDGVALTFSKEVDAPEVVGKSMRDGLRDALARRGVKAPARIVLLNDTVAALLSGLAEIPADGGGNMGADRYGVAPGPVLGCILGTGFNTAYPETDIPKTGFHSDAPQIVVCESGNSTPRYLGVLDREFDAGTQHPGAYTLEKAVSGAYLGPLTFHILKRAIADGVLSFARADEFAAMPALETRVLNGFMHTPLAGEGPIGGLFGRDELDAIRAFAYLTSIVTQRGAMFAAAAIAAAARRAGGGFDPFSPVRIAIEGTTYAVYKGMKETLDAWLRVMLTREKPRSYVLQQVEQASLSGAAVAALLG